MEQGFEEISIGLEEVWNPEEEKTIQGKLVEIKNGVGDNNSTMYVVELADGTRKSLWESTVLKTKLSQVNLLDEIRIEYLGLKKSAKSGREYKDFAVGVKRAS